MKKIFLLGLMLLISAFAITAIAAPTAPADGYKMAKTKKPVVFNHSTHTAIKCAECHHPVNGKEDYRACSTAGCHDNMDQKDKSINSYYQAMHKAKGAKFDTCISCHNKVAGADKDKKKALSGCAKSKCHP
ncbi:cytochrome c3 family protein [Desulfovibrio sp. OttesenSCG-928-F07]|nr:cytochrome c3 family protein [Desulfovibrio sp. OttesenSCG-928-F07]